jgi:hypothetical protein
MIKVYKVAVPMYVEKRSNNVGTRGSEGRMCGVPDCDNRAETKLLCDNHYRRARQFAKAGGFEDVTVALLHQLARITRKGYKRARAMASK